MDPAKSRKLLFPMMLVLVAAGFLLPARPAAAQKAYLLAFVGTTQGTVKGTSTVKGHEGWLEVNSAEIGNLAFTNQNSAAISSATSAGSTGKVRFNSLTIHRSIDSASPALFQAATGRKFSQLTIECLSGSAVQHRLTISGGSMSVKPDGPGKEAIIFVGGNVAYH